MSKLTTAFDHVHHAHVDQVVLWPQIILILPFTLGLVLYLLCLVISNRRYKRWPRYRTLLWLCGICCAGSAVIGPLAQRAHFDFTVHMLGHLLLGMLAPLLMALASPLTLLMRSLSVSAARKFTRLLHHPFFTTLRDPIVASVLNIGGLWVLYTTPLYTVMHHYALLHVFIHFHVFLAGYLFTISMINVDLKTMKTSYLYRLIVLVMALAGHGILAKLIYAHPPGGVPKAEAELGSMLMYYGGDAVDLILIVIFCYQWYHDKRPRADVAVQPEYFD
jgi:putative membrane protein